MTRWLNGRVKPNPGNVRAVNKAVASLTASSEVEPYLTILAAIDDIDDFGFTEVDIRNPTSGRFGRMVVSSGRLLREFSGFFEADIHKTVADLMRREPVEGFALCVGLARVRGAQSWRAFKEWRQSDLFRYGCYVV